MKKSEQKGQISKREQVSLYEKVKLLFSKPSELFKYYNNKSWRLIFLAIALIATVFTFIQYYLIDNNEVNNIISSEIDPELAEAALNMPKSLGEAVMFSVFMIIVVFITVLISSTAYYILVNAYGGKIKFSEMTAVYSTAFVIILLGDLIMMIFHFITGSKFSLNLNPYINILVNQLSLFNIGGLILVFAGIRTISGLSRRKTITVIAIIAIAMIIYKVGTVSLTQAIYK
jgi:hypothetical protein